jgi:hypothetical protein
VAVPLKERAYRSHPISVIASQRVPALIETCKLNDIDPFAYLTDVFTESPTATHTTRSTDCFRGLQTSRPQSCGLKTTLALEPNQPSAKNDLTEGRCQMRTFHWRHARGNRRVARKAASDPQRL